MAGPVNTAMNNQNPYYSAHPRHLVPGNYFLPPPPTGPGPYDYEAALHHW